MYTIFLLEICNFLAPCNLSDVKWKLKPVSQQSKYWSDYRHPSNVQEIDLSSVLPFCPFCFVVINLFNGVNVVPAKMPIIIRRLFPVRVFMKVQYVSLQLAQEVQKRGSVFISSRNVSKFCPSRFFNVAYELCTHASFHNFSVSSRSWNSELYVYLLPPAYHIKLNSFWNYGYRFGRRNSGTGILGILVKDSSTDKFLTWFSFYPKKIIRVYDAKENIILIAICLEILTKQNNVITMFLPCDFCIPSITITGIVSSLTVFEIKHKFDRMLVNTRNISTWRLNELSGIKYEENCGNQSTPYLLKYSHLHELDKLLLCLKIKETWENILALNFKLISSKSEANPHTKVNFYPLSAIDALSFVVAHPMTQIKFIACGDTFGKRNTNFHVFMESFNNQSWVSIVLLLGILVPLSWYILSLDFETCSEISFSEFFEIFAAVFKNSFEQSTPYNSKLLSKTSLKLLACITLLCVQILSNAYKNDNMHSMMKPEVFHPFKKFEQLLSANYSVYSVPYYLSVDWECNINLSIFTVCLQNSFTDNHKFDLNITTNSKLQQISYYFIKNSLKQIITNDYEYLYNNSMLWMEPIYKQAQLMRKTLFVEEQNVRGPTKHFENDIETEVSILQKLKECNNTAFVDDNTKVLKWKLILEQKGIKKLSVGRDVMISKYFGFELHGWIPKFIVKRIRGIMSSGIMEWWNEIVSVHLVKVRTSSGGLIGTDEKFNKLEYTKIDERKSRSFFLIFYFVLELGLMATICCIIERLHSERI